MPIEKIVYKCEHCEKMFNFRESCELHEESMHERLCGIKPNSELSYPKMRYPYFIEVETSSGCLVAYQYCYYRDKHGNIVDENERI